MEKLAFFTRFLLVKNRFFEKPLSKKYLGSKSVKNKKVVQLKDTLPQKNLGQKVQK